MIMTLKLMDPDLLSVLTLITKLQSNLAFFIQHSAKYPFRSNSGLQRTFCQAAVIFDLATASPQCLPRTLER